MNNRIWDLLTGGVKIEQNFPRRYSSPPSSFLSPLGPSAVIVLTNFAMLTEHSVRLSDDSWEIAFESISDLQWLGSGAQGAVFSGKYKNQTVAVKKVRDQKETDIKHLRKLNHPNIVQFK